jgi:hypothetical protein
MVGAGAGLLWAGPLNPPTGPISSGGKTTQEIYDAVTGISNSIGGSGRGPAVPGSSVAAGSLSIPASGPFAAINVPLIGLRLSMTGANYQSNGQILGTTTLTGCTLVREIGAGGASQLRMMSGGFAMSTATATINAPGGGTTTYQFGPAVISGMRSYSVQRADGTYASIEEIDLSMQSVRVTDSGGTWMYNFITHTGGG